MSNWEGARDEESVQVARDAAAAQFAPESSPDAFRHALFVATPRAWATPTLVGINVAVFLAMVISGVSISRPSTASLIRWGADFGPLTIGGEWWRMLTNTFVHIGIIHIAMNMFGLWQVGFLVERLLGNSRFVVTYLLSGLTGSLVSLAVHPDVVSAGASGAVFGIFGALLGYVLRRRAAIPRLILRSLLKMSLTFVGLNLLFGLQMKGIDMAAHGGGFVGGALCAFFVARPLGLRTQQRVDHGRRGNARADWLHPLLVLGVGLLILAGLCALLPQTLDTAFSGAV